MPKEPQFYHKKETPVTYDYEADAAWRKKPLTPQQLLVHDVRLETLRPDRGPLLEINERQISTIVPETAAHTPSASFVRVVDASDNPFEKQKFSNLEEDFGWTRYLRLESHQQHANDSQESAKVRWIHCSSKFPEYLRGFLRAMSDDLETLADSMRMLDKAMQRHTRFSKHGKYFAPFAQTLRPQSGDNSKDVYPMLISAPFSTGPFKVDLRRSGSKSIAGRAFCLPDHLLMSFAQCCNTSIGSKTQPIVKDLESLRGINPGL